MASVSSSPYSRARLTSALTTTQHVSALVFGSFLFVYLAAPSVAAVASHGGALDLSTKTMILGRVYYQNALTEPFIVYGAAAVHVLASLAKRALHMQQSLAKRGRKGRHVEGYTIPDTDDDLKEGSDGRWSALIHRLYRSFPSIHTLTGAALLPAVAIHVWLNRIAPSSSEAPIHALSPSELDYSYVTYGLSRSGGVPRAWHRITIALYGILLVAGAVHVVAGADRIAQRARARAQLKKETARAVDTVSAGSSSSPRHVIRQEDLKRKKQRKAVATASVSAAGVAWLTWGLVKMSRETSGVSGYLAKRVQACYAQVWPYSIWE